MKTTINLALTAVYTLLDMAPLLILGGVCMWMVRTNQTGTTVVPIVLAIGALFGPILAETVDRLRARLIGGSEEPDRPEIHSGGKPQIEEGREHQ